MKKCMLSILYLCILAGLLTSCSGNKNEKPNHTDDIIIVPEPIFNEISVSPEVTPKQTELEFSDYSIEQFMKLLIYEYPSEVKPFDFASEEVKEAIITALNDEHWWSGGSPDFSINEQPFNLEIYTKEHEINTLRIVLYNSSDFDGYYLAILHYNDMGLLIDIFSSNSLYSYEEVQVTMAELGYTFDEKTTIIFPPITSPDYPEVTPEKEIALSNFIYDIKYRMLVWENGKGKYTIYIRNYRNNSQYTYAVVENDQGDQWFVDIKIEKDGTLLLDNLEEATIYRADQINLIKEYSAIVQEINLD